MFFKFNQRNLLLGIMVIHKIFRTLIMLTLLGIKVLTFPTHLLQFLPCLPPSKMTREIVKRFTVKKSQNSSISKIQLSVRKFKSPVYIIVPACYSLPCRSQINFLCESLWYTLIDIKYLPISQPHEPQHESPI